MKRILSAALILVMLFACTAAIAEAGSYVDTSKGNTYLRTSASLSGKAISVLHVGEAAEYLGQKAVDSRGVTWYKVSFNSKTGWVSEKYTKLHTNASSVKATGGDSNVRSAANLNGKSLGTLKKGESAMYLGETKKDDREVSWYKILFNGKTGWVSEKYTKLQ